MKAIVVGSVSPFVTVSIFRSGSLIAGSPFPIEAATPGMSCCAYMRCDKNENIKIKIKLRNRVLTDNPISEPYTLAKEVGIPKSIRAYGKILEQVGQS
jgi:hypothetical protein